MDQINKLKKVLDNFDFKASLEKSKVKNKSKYSVKKIKEDILLFSETYLLVDGYSEYKEEGVPLGATKLYGSPHLPDDIHPDDDEIFLGQFNMEQLKPFDFKNILPIDSGMCYFFVRPGEDMDMGRPLEDNSSDDEDDQDEEDYMDEFEEEYNDSLRVLGRVYYSDAPIDQLKVRKIPNGGKSVPASRVFDFNNASENTFFEQSPYFDLKGILGEDYDHFMKELESNDVCFNVYEYSSELPDEFFFGQPQCLQGEGDGTPVLFSVDSLSVDFCDSGDCVFNFCLPYHFKNIEDGGLNISCT